jgi:hypothetical protein
LVTPGTPLRKISSAERPVIAWLKVRVNCVVVCVDEPLAVTLLKVTAVSPPPPLLWRMATVLGEPLMSKPDFATATLNVPPELKPLIPKV